MLYGLCGQDKPRIRPHERFDALMDWNNAENNALWTLLANTKERTNWSTTHIDPLSFRGPDLGLPHARTWWQAPTDNSVCHYPGLGRFTWAQVRDHAPRLGFGLQMNEDGFGVSPLPTIEELNAIKGISTDISSEYTPKDRPTRADLCNYPGLTRFNWGQLRLIANITCLIKIQLFQPFGDVVVGRHHVSRWRRPELQALRRLRTNDPNLMKQCHQPPKSQEKCDYPGLESFNWRMVCVRAMELGESDPGADRPKRSEKTWSPEELTALETFLSNHPDWLIGARGKDRPVTPCQIPGLEDRTWSQVTSQVYHRGLQPGKWSPEQLAALQTLLADDPDKLVEGRSGKMRSKKCPYPGLEAMTWSKVVHKAGQLQKC
ncbi:hypothetical protein F5883DRAFT_557306 [Diaporthe sp. PMI_573]|nr:hypothetical protein F5883DRAFT_557306 [Diaporthaceae sp. PMI_573]